MLLMPINDNIVCSVLFVRNNTVINILNLSLSVYSDIDSVFVHICANHILDEILF